MVPCSCAWSAAPWAGKSPASKAACSASSSTIRPAALSPHYQYNAANQLVAVEKDRRRTEYRYDPPGRRIAKIGPDSTTEFLWNGDVLAWEQKGPDKTLYVYEPNSFRPLAQIRNGDVYHHHLDHLGTPQELTDAHGNLAWSVGYRAYGNVVRKEVESVENNLRFQGQYYDAESGFSSVVN